jgi:hypothetical protein
VLEVHEALFVIAFSQRCENLIGIHGAMLTPARDSRARMPLW